MSSRTDRLVEMGAVWSRVAEDTTSTEDVELLVALGDLGTVTPTDFLTLGLIALGSEPKVSNHLS